MRENEADGGEEETQNYPRVIVCVCVCVPHIHTDESLFRNVKVVVVDAFCILHDNACAWHNLTHTQTDAHTHTPRYLSNQTIAGCRVRASPPLGIAWIEIDNETELLFSIHMMTTTIYHCVTLWIHDVERPICSHTHWWCGVRAKEIDKMRSNKKRRSNTKTVRVNDAHYNTKFLILFAVKSITHITYAAAAFAAAHPLLSPAIKLLFFAAFTFVLRITDDELLTDGVGWRRLWQTRI